VILPNHGIGIVVLQIGGVICVIALDVLLRLFLLHLSSRIGLVFEHQTSCAGISRLLDVPFFFLIAILQEKKACREKGSSVKVSHYFEWAGMSDILSQRCPKFDIKKQHKLFLKSPQLLSTKCLHVRQRGRVLTLDKKTSGAGL
jgi:hypothetical protein